MQQLIEDGSWQPGLKLSPLPVLSHEFGVAAGTMRLVLDELESRGLISRILGRGTFVQQPPAPAVLIADDEVVVREILRSHLTRAGFRPVEATTVPEAVAALRRDPSIALVLTDIRMPQKEDGIAFIRTVRLRWPEIPLAVVTGFPEDLSELNAADECPALVVLKPIRANQVAEALRLVQRPHPRVEPRRAAPVLVVEPDRTSQEMLHTVIAGAGHEIETAASAESARVRLRQRYFSHAFFDAHLPGGGPITAAILDEHPATTVVLMTESPCEAVEQHAGPVVLLRKPLAREKVLGALRLHASA